jgi:putative transposase
MHRSQAGEIVAGEWVRTESVRPEVRLDGWVVMPNHVHGIIEIMGTDGTPRSPADGRSRLVAGSLGAIIGQFKAACTKRIRKAVRPDFGWQDRFHDHIIRDEEALQMIRWYIRSNPSRWSSDRMYRV